MEKVRCETTIFDQIYLIIFNACLNVPFTPTHPDCIFQWLLSMQLHYVVFCMLVCTECLDSQWSGFYVIFCMLVSTECLDSQWSGFYVIFCMLFSKECVASQWSGLYAVYLQLSLSIPGDSLYRGEMWPIRSCQQGQSNYPKPKQWDIDQKYMGSLFVTNFSIEVGTNTGNCDRNFLGTL